MLSKEEFAAKAQAAIATVAPNIRKLTMEDNARDFASLGLDSLDSMNFLLELESVLGMPLGDVDLALVNSIDKLYACYAKL